MESDIYGSSRSSIRFGVAVIDVLGVVFGLVLLCRVFCGVGLVVAGRVFAFLSPIPHKWAGKFPLVWKAVACDRVWKCQIFITGKYFIVLLRNTVF